MNDMSYLDKPLNARQLEVLHWIAGGCPGGVMQGHAYKTSAVALQSRRLVKISRRGGVWTSQINEAGHAYLQTGHFLLPQNGFRWLSGRRGRRRRRRA